MVTSLKLKSKLITVDYFAIYIIKTSPGVINKINQTVCSLNSNGYVARSVISPWAGITNKIKYAIQLMQSQADILLIRNTSLQPFLVPIMLWKRLQGKKIIIDIPTPLTINLHELKMCDMNSLALGVRIAALVTSFPWALYPANKVLQYAHESAYFSIGVRNKTQLIANGIDVASIPFRKNTPVWPINTFIMVAVGSLGQWHAFDRAIRGIANYKNSTSSQEKVNIHLIIVGDGECRQSWEKLAEELGVLHCVEFTGFKTGSELTQLVDLAHVAVASLGLFRKGLDMASDLKSREYTARGLPFIAAGDDIDFDPTPGFVLKLENSDVPVDMGSVISWYENLAKNENLALEIRRYADDQLDFSKKMPQLLDC